MNNRKGCSSWTVVQPKGCNSWTAANTQWEKKKKVPKTFPEHNL